MTKDEWIQKAKAFLFDCTCYFGPHSLRDEAEELIEEAGGYDAKNESATSPLSWKHQCKISTGICGSLTFGTGKLDEHGYWENPCYRCARLYKIKHPNDLVWPTEDHVPYRELDNGKIVLHSAHVPKNSIQSKLMLSRVISLISFILFLVAMLCLLNL